MILLPTKIDEDHYQFIAPEGVYRYVRGVVVVVEPEE